MENEHTRDRCYVYLKQNKDYSVLGGHRTQAGDYTTRIKITVNFLEGIARKQVTTKTCLGVIFDEKLTFNPHIEYICSTALRALNYAQVTLWRFSSHFTPFQWNVEECNAYHEKHYTNGNEWHGTARNGKCSHMYCSV